MDRNMGIANFLKTIKRRLKILLKARRINDPARNYFERFLIPRLGASRVRDVLFVGVGPYTWHYSELFRKQGVNYITLDRRPEAITWGSPAGHITCDIQDVKNHIEDMPFDLIIIMGVIGYGVNDPETAKNMLSAATKLLKPRGRILVACESRFGIDPVKVGHDCPTRLVTTSSYGLDGMVKLPDYDYGFYFMVPEQNSSPAAT
jgi:hypothetical protein